MIHKEIDILDIKEVFYVVLTECDDFEAADEIENISQASESIIGAMKAFNIEASSAMSIVDKFNEVGNNFAISSVGIGDALQRSAALLAKLNEAERRERDARNELCLKCGRYREAHKGACDGCRWRNNSNA